MRGLGILAALLLAAGAATLAYATTLGQARVLLVVVVPVIVGTGPWGLLGSLLVMAGLVAGFAAWAAGAQRPRSPAGPLGAPRGAERGPPAAAPPGEAAPAPRRKVAGFVLLGPLPIAFGSTRELALAMLVLAVVVLAVLLLLPRLLGAGA